MAQTYRARFLAVMRANEARMTALFTQLAQRVAATVVRFADADGVVPRTKTFDLQRVVDEQVTAFFLHPWGGELRPFEVQRDGSVLPLSPYARALWIGFGEVTRLAVGHHAQLMQRRLPMGVQRTMQRATLNPFVAANRQVREQLFRPNPLAAYDAPHTWVDPNGYRLSDRIWNTASNTRRRLDGYLDDAVRRGAGAAAMARELEQFLVPGQSLKRTRAPYGTDASFDAMRLARTEISRAHAQASEMSAAMNPFVESVQIVLSHRHRKRDICDDAAAAGPWPKDAVPDEYRLPLHSQCVTPGQLVQTAQGNVAIESIVSGDLVITHQGHCRPVLATWSTPHNGPVYEIVTERGHLEVTGNHPILLRRGWVNAQDVKLGDEVLYAGGGIGVDPLSGVTEDTPPLPLQPGIPPNVVTGLAGVPTTIALYGDLDRGHGNVNEVATDAVFAFVDDAECVQHVLHGSFEGAGIGKTAISEAHEHRKQSGVMAHPREGDFAAHFGAAHRVFVAREVETTHRVPYYLSKGFAARAVVLLPTGGNRVGFVAHGNAVVVEQIAQCSKAQAEPSSNDGAGQSLPEINVNQEFSGGPSILCLDVKSVEFGPSQVVLGEVGSGHVFHTQPTDGASEHDSLLALSPDFEWGPGSGSPVVGGFMRPAQALLHYSTVTAINQRHYTGLVYNMEVAEDHSYTVGGAAVHNCMCRYAYVMQDAAKTQATLAALRDEVRAARAELVNQIGPLQVEQFTNLLLGRGLTIDRGFGVALPMPLPVPLPAPAVAVAAPAIVTAPSPAAAPATPAPMPPSGTKVSAALQGPSRGKSGAITNAVADAIDDTHGDGGLTEVPVKFGAMSTRHGHYKSYTNGKPVEIKISTTSEHPHTTMAHEVGHFLDGQRLNVGQTYAQYARRYDEMPQVYRDFFDAVRGSEAFDLLTRIRMGEVRIGYVVNGKVQEMLADPRYVSYLLNADELWARAYAQYITVRSGNATMLAELNATRANYPFPTQWTDADFAPIASAIDAILRQVGWLP